MRLDRTLSATIRGMTETQTAAAADTMQVFLNIRIAGVGEKDDLVTVDAEYGDNLIKAGLADKGVVVDHTDDGEVEQAPPLLQSTSEMVARADEQPPTPARLTLPADDEPMRVWDEFATANDVEYDHAGKVAEQKQSIADAVQARNDASTPTE